MHQTSIGALRGMAMVVGSLALTACPSEVRVEDAAGGAGSSGTTTSATATATISTSTSTGGDFDVHAACVSACDNECVAGPNSCLEYCLEDAQKTSRCARESVALNACQYLSCVPYNDCEAEADAFYECERIRCEPWTCTGTDDACDCVAGKCEEGYTRRAVCASDGQSNILCDCYENEAFVLQCTSWAGCAPHTNCCQEILD